jgi:hypothetical protein
MVRHGNAGGVRRVPAGLGTVRQSNAGGAGSGLARRGEVWTDEAWFSKAGVAWPVPSR